MHSRWFVFVRGMLEKDGPEPGCMAAGCRMRGTHVRFAAVESFFGALVLCDRHYRVFAAGQDVQMKSQPRLMASPLTADGEWSATV